MADIAVAVILREVIGRFVIKIMENFYDKGDKNIFFGFVITIEGGSCHLCFFYDIRNRYFGKILLSINANNASVIFFFTLKLASFLLSIKPILF